MPTLTRSTVIRRNVSIFIISQWSSTIDQEFWINAPDRLFVARNGVAELTGVELADSEVRDLVERMMQYSGRRVDLSSPFVDASLSDIGHGSTLAAASTPGAEMQSRSMCGGAMMVT